MLGELGCHLGRDYLDTAELYPLKRTWKNFGCCRHGGFRHFSRHPRMQNFDVLGLCNREDSWQGFTVSVRFQGLQCMWVLAVFWGLYTFSV